MTYQYRKTMRELEEKLQKLERAIRCTEDNLLREKDWSRQMVILDDLNRMRRQRTRLLNKQREIETKRMFGQL